jgi:Transposase DDE domain group 1
MTECIPPTMAFQELGNRDVLAAFDGGRITSDAGALLLREVDSHFGFVDRFAACFTDHRDAGLVEHPLVDLLKQRVFGLCLGYEDLNDHDRLRLDPLLAVAVGKADPFGTDRTDPADRGKPLAGKSTLNRLELTPVGADEDSRYKKTVAHMSQIENVFVDVFLHQHTTPPERIVLDLDSTDDPLHGQQLGRFFHGYTATIVTCPCTSSAATIRWPPSCGRATSMLRPAVSNTWTGS